MTPFFYGYLQVKLISSSPERFFNACSNKDIYLWGLISESDGCKFNIKISDFKKLKPILRTTHSHIYILKRKGFPFVLNHFKQKFLFTVGAIICLILVYYLSSMIWSIEINGNQTCTNEQILKYLESENIRKGIPSKSVNCTEIAANIRKKYNEIIWVSASIEGTNLKLNIKENENNQNIIKQNKSNMSAQDLIATNDCIIEKVIIRNGISMVKPGDNVKKGTVLVTGQIPVYNDAKEIISYKQCVADADIIGKIVVDYQDSILYSYESKILYKDIFKKQYYIKLNNSLFSLGSIKNDYTNRYLHSVQKKYNDISFGIRTVKPYHLQEKNYTQKEIQLILTKRFNDYCEQLKKKGVVILQNNVKINTWREEACASGSLLIQTSVATSHHSDLIKITEQNTIQSGD